jgi:hypothetical protein
MGSREEIRAQQQAVRDAFGEQLWDEISRILFEEDSIRINFGSNTDEYEPEVRTILPRLVGCQAVEDARRVVHEEFVRWFGERIAGPPERYDRVAERVWQAWSSEPRP